MPPLYMLAHTTQFVRPGCKYVDSSAVLKGGLLDSPGTTGYNMSASMVAFVCEDDKTFTMVRNHNAIAAADGATVCLPACLPAYLAGWLPGGCLSACTYWVGSAAAVGAQVVETSETEETIDGSFTITPPTFHDSTAPLHLWETCNNSYFKPKDELLLLQGGAPSAAAGGMQYKATLKPQCIYTITSSTGQAAVPGAFCPAAPFCAQRAVHTTC
jgi:hypothetical protein